VISDCERGPFFDSITKSIILPHLLILLLYRKTTRVQRISPWTSATTCYTILNKYILDAFNPKSDVFITVFTQAFHREPISLVSMIIVVFHGLDKFIENRKQRIGSRNRYSKVRNYGFTMVRYYVISSYRFRVR